MTIGREDEKGTLRSLQEMAAKKKFLDVFWKSRDPSPGTKSNEALVTYYMRYEQANQQFGSVNRSGWKTDMGRVFIMYGPPAQIEKHEFDANMPPYQIWYYLQLEGQSTQTIFVFADKEGLNLQRLVHSNARGEFYNPNWQNEIKQIR
jgi:GWxTD domain-containing protein